MDNVILCVGVGLMSVFNSNELLVNHEMKQLIVPQVYSLKVVLNIALFVKFSVKVYYRINNCI